MNEHSQNPYSAVSARQSEARSLPRHVYTDAAVFRWDAEHVLQSGWLPVARVSELANVGDYRSVNLLGTPLLVTRDAAGLHVISRVCRHRGMPVIDGHGNRSDFSCPYHLWRYALDGQLLFAPAMEQSASFDPARCGLQAVAHEQWGGWVFANLSGTAPSLTPALADLDVRLANAHPEHFVTAATLEFDSPWNWKVMVENFLESYHHIGPHASTLQQVNPAFGTYASAHEGAFTVLENPPKGDADPFVVACVFPLTLFAVTESVTPWAVWYEFDALEQQRFLLRIHLLTSPEHAKTPHLIAAYVDAIRAIHIEDIDVCAGVQAGYRSVLATSGPLSHLEGCLWHFHRYLQRAGG
jgi:phenylpropionate dioxygenase-like ring-hydroxylating dioxygenase large terminal subunit